MLNSLLRKSAVLAWLSSGLAVAQDDAAPVGEANVPPAATVGSGWSVTSIPVLQQVWTAQAALDPGRDQVAYFSNDESVVYVQSTAGTVTAINAESGREFWSTQVGQADEVSLQASSNNNVVVIASGPTLYGFDKFSGAKLFSFRLPEQPRGGPVLTHGTVVIPLGEGFVSAFTLDTLKHLGRFNVLPKGQASASDWRYGSGEILRYPPVAGRDRLAFASDHGNVHAVNLAGPKKGEAEFQFLMKQRATAPLTLLTRDDREFLLAVSADDRLFCIELQTNGSMRWTAPLGRQVTKPVVAVGTDVFVLADDGELSVLDLLTGKPREVLAGTSGVASRRDQASESVPSFGAAVEVRLDGAPEFHPFRLANRSTRQTVRSVQLDLSSAVVENLTFAVDEQSKPIVRVAGASAGISVKSVELSEDRKKLTAVFTEFVPGAAVEFHADLEHPTKAQREITDRDLDGTGLTATVAISSTASADATQRVLGELKARTNPWKITGVESLAAISEHVVYAIDNGGRLIACLRTTAEVIESHNVPEYSRHISNGLTDRVYLGTSAGQIACYAEKRVELGVLPLPLGGGFTWVLYPESELAPDFASFHQHPEDQPIMPDVPETTPAAVSVGAP